MRIALFVTCLNDALFPQAGIATVTVLERLGHTVAFPAAQSCCGQMHANTGYAAPARQLERLTESAFAGHDVIVSPPAPASHTCAPTPPSPSTNSPNSS
ncbi:heterodisulfide reductase-related iron-sulfur binding cluster [Catellatospora coxensis]